MKPEYLRSLKPEYLRSKHEIIISEANLIDFIHKSKLKGFASGDSKVIQSDGSSLYSNRELPWLYTDTYCGNIIERGHEDVYYDMALIWSMQYRGGVYAPYWKNADTVNAFLRQALSNAPKDFPIRGPEKYRSDLVQYEGNNINGDFLYKNKYIGNIGHFMGQELIYWNDDLAFYHDYIGGIVRNKYYPSKIITTALEHESATNDQQALLFHPERRSTMPPK